MKPLPERFRQKGFELELVQRTKKVALYKRYQSNPAKCHYEVIVVQSHNGRMIGDRFIEPAEFYPSDSQWGQSGWTFTEGMSGSREQALTDAKQRFEEILNKTSK